MQQVSFEGITNLSRNRKTRKQKFLEEMDKAVPWVKMVAVIKPYCPKGERGRRPFPLETMLRIHFMQQWFGISDPGMEDELHDNVPMRAFAGLAAAVTPNRRDNHLQVAASFGATQAGEKVVCDQSAAFG